MKSTYQYRLIPTTEQKLALNDWLRTCRYWYNTQLGERFSWWQTHRSNYVVPQGDFCSISCSIAPKELKVQPRYYEQKKQLPVIKQDLVKVNWSGELLNFSDVPSQTLQEVCKRVELAMDRFIGGDCNGKRSGKPRFKSKSRFRSMVFEGSKLHSCSVGGKFLYLSLPKLGLVKVRHHRPLPDDAMIKSAQVVKKVDVWYINLRLQDNTIPDYQEDITPTWDNSLGMDAVLYEDNYLATSEGVKLPALKSFRRSQAKLANVSRQKVARKKGSKARRKLAQREARVHQRIARARRDHAYKTAHALMRTGKKVFFHEKLNLKGLSRRNAPIILDEGRYIANGQSRKAGLNKSWSDAAFGQFFNILGYIAGKAGAQVKAVNPAYTSQLLPYRDEFVFTDVSIRKYWDDGLKLWVDRDIASSINIKRVGLDVFPTIKRRRGNPIVSRSTTNSTSKQVLSVLCNLEKPTPVLEESA